MKPPVLVIATPLVARVIRPALAEQFSVTVIDDIARARALAATEAFLAVVACAPLSAQLPGALELELAGDPTALISRVRAEIAKRNAADRARARNDEVGAIPYDELVELARYAVVRRYLASLLTRHRGSVTDAAREARMKRESLHRLLRRHHLLAEDFRNGDQRGLKSSERTP